MPASFGRWAIARPFAADADAVTDRLAAGKDILRRQSVSIASRWPSYSIATLRYRVFGSLYRPSPDDLPSRLRLEYCWLLCERIDAAPLLCGGLLDDNEFGESGHKEGSRFLEFLVAYFRERLDDALDVLPRHIVRMKLSNFLNEFRLRHQLGHVSSLVSNRLVTMLA